MNIENVPNADAWELLFNHAGSPSFLQAWEWGELQRQLGHEVERIVVKEQGREVAIAQIIKQRVRRGSFVYIPHGPLLVERAEDIDYQAKIIHTVRDYLEDFCRREGFSFIRIAPILQNTPETRNLYRELKFSEAPIFINADEHIWVLPLNKSPDDLLKDMRKTTRYLIRRAPKDGVEIEMRTDIQAVDDFWPIYEETTKREQFSPFSRSFIRQEFEAFHARGNALFLFGKAPHQGEKNKYLASALVVFTQSTAFYHQGASIHTKLPVPYLLQWYAIQEAHKRGCMLYNFWGVAPENDPNHPWKGLTLFKKGFGGQGISYLPTQDYIISPRYALTYVYEKWLRWKRGV